MWKRRQLFNAIFFLGTIIAALAWIGEMKGWHTDSYRIKFGNIAIGGHIIQIIGAFGSLVTPDAEEEKKDFE
jgi:hypothetical protein